MISLAVDIGNTRIKASVFDHSSVLDERVTDTASLPEIIAQFKPAYAVLSAVGSRAEEIIRVIGEHHIPLLHINHQTSFPFTIDYETPHTLGMDRLAGVAAAQHLYPQTHCLVIDAGTCITYDFITAEGVYKGGAIAPGLTMRLRAMHEFTHKLPQPELRWPADFEGKSTEQSLLSGVVPAVADEINARIDRYMQRYGPVQAILCGGDAPLLSEQLKNNIFAVPSLIMKGLNQILLFNVNKG
jgi:type III pantothenate kinase